MARLRGEEPKWSRLRSLRYRALGVVFVVTAAPLILVSWAGTGSSVSERMLERLALESPEAALNLRYPLSRLTLLILPGAVVFAAWLGWRMVRPIERLRDQVRGKVDDISKAGDLDASRPDELGDLAGSFNQLLDQLDSRRRQNEAFVADLAHEFKSPVAAIRAAAEALDPRPGAELDPAYLERIARIARIMRDSGHRLDVLLTQFLELARAEAGMLDAEWTPVDLGALARGIAGSFEQDPRYAELAFEVDAPDELRTMGVASELESALRNLIDNAASFATDRVRVGVRFAGARIVVEVDDDGPGVCAQDAPRVFERFFTGPRPGAQLRGTGLGLALVRAVAVAHGGVASVGDAPGGGARFTLELASHNQGS